MPRKPRIVAPHYPHHITQRGNYRQNVFQEDGDRAQYLAWVEEYSVKYNLKIWAYCLMSNHVHFIAVPLDSSALSRTFNQAHMRYAQYFNRKNGWTGHLWQGRFFSCCLNEPHLWAAVKYVENNPVRAGLVEKAEDYPWSSAPFHIKGTGNSLLADDLPLLGEIPDWRSFLARPLEKNSLDTIRANTRSGRPAGDDSFVGKLESLLGITIHTKPPGRPRKKKNRREAEKARKTTNTCIKDREGRED